MRKDTHTQTHTTDKKSGRFPAGNGRTGSGFYRRAHIEQVLVSISRWQKEIKKKKKRVKREEWNKEVSWNITPFP